jgi:mannose-binding lectin 2
LYVSVSTDIENKAAWKECLSVQGVRLPTGYYFGITAATGDLSDIHDIMSVRLYELDLPDDVSIDAVITLYKVHKVNTGLLFCLSTT